MALAFELKQLIDMMSIGTLLAYSIVALCVMVLRYSEGSDDNVLESDGSIWGRLVNIENRQRPTRSTSIMASFLISLFLILSLTTCAVMASLGDALYAGTSNGVVPLSVMGVAMVIILALLSRQPKSDAANLSFSVPLLPWLPSISLFLNMYLMAELDLHTWIRFIVWMILGTFKAEKKQQNSSKIHNW